MCEGHGRDERLFVRASRRMPLLHLKVNQTRMATRIPFALVHRFASGYNQNVFRKCPSVRNNVLFLLEVGWMNEQENSDE